MSVFDWLNPVGGLMSGIASIGGTIGNLVGQSQTNALQKEQLEESNREFNEQMNIANQNMQLQQHELDWQHAQQEKQYEREDTSYQRTVNDMRAAGLNPLMISGTDGSGSMVSTTAPQLDATSAYATKGANRANQLALQQQKTELQSRKFDMLIKAGEALQTIRDPGLIANDRLGASLQNEALRIKNLMDSRDSDFMKANGFSSRMSEKAMLTQIVNQGGYYDSDGNWHNCNLTDYAQYYNLANDSPTNVLGGDLARANAVAANSISHEFNTGASVATEKSDLGTVIKESLSNVLNDFGNSEDIIDSVSNDITKEEIKQEESRVEQFNNDYQTFIENNRSYIKAALLRNNKDFSSEAKTVFNKFFNNEPLTGPENVILLALITKYYNGAESTKNVEMLEYFNKTITDAYDKKDQQSKELINQFKDKMAEKEKLDDERLNNLKSSIESLGYNKGTGTGTYDKNKGKGMF